MLEITEIKMKCNKCGNEKIYNNVEIEASEYNQFVVTIKDMKDTNFEGWCDCRYDECVKELLGDEK